MNKSLEQIAKKIYIWHTNINIRKYAQHHKSLGKWAMRYYYTLIRMTKMKKTNHTKSCQGCRGTGILVNYWWHVKWYNHLG